MSDERIRVVMVVMLLVMVALLRSEDAMRTSAALADPTPIVVHGETRVQASDGQEEPCQPQVVDLSPLP